MSKLARVTVQLACGAEDRMSEVLGPFEYVELTYDELWEPDRTRVIASFIDGWWVDTKGDKYSDITFVGEA